MTVTAIIAEYNPFHNGHAYHLQLSRKETNADFLVVVMSGDFVQRGEPAVIGKFARAKMALAAGADLVLELPPCYACASAEYFAGGAVSLLNSLGCVDYLCFGSESGDISALSVAADILAREPQAYRAALKHALRMGDPYPKARQFALSQALANSAASDALSQTLANNAASDTLSQPNDILGTEYLKALKKTESRIRPIAIRRKGSGYHDRSLAGGYPSATAIREAFWQADAGFPAVQEDISDVRTFIPNVPPAMPDVRSFVPDAAFSCLKDAWGKQFPLFLDDFSFVMHHCLLSASSFADYMGFFDVPETLARRIFRMRYAFTDPTSFTSLVWTRNFTKAQVRRALLHILLSIPADLAGLSQFRHDYAKILGLRRSAGELLRAIKTKGHLPLLAKPADARAILSQYYEPEKAQEALSFLSADRHCHDVYQAALTAKFHEKAVSENAHGICVL